MTARIVHIALKVDDLEAATKFYSELFGFKEAWTGRNGAHISRHMTDGTIDLALMKYDSEDSAEAELTGPGECIHHFGIEYDDRGEMAEKIKKLGGEILSKPDARALKFRTPHGVIAELVNTGSFEKKSPSKQK